VGAGTPPIPTGRGWLVFYHGVEGTGDDDPDRRYHAGALLLDLNDPGRILYRSPRPVLSPESDEERTGVVNNVVFPCGAVVQPDGQVEVYYGMADRAIGLATTRLTDWNAPDRAGAGASDRYEVRLATSRLPLPRQDDDHDFEEPGLTGQR
jgi:predicted GH43/DUF377 family glycosyl hydrolase